MVDGRAAWRDTVILAWLFVSAVLAAPAVAQYRAEVVPQVGHADRIEHMAFSLDGHLAATAGSDKSVMLWAVESGRLLRTFRGHAQEVHAVAISPDGRRVLSGSSDGTAKVWDAATGSLVHSFERLPKSSFPVAFSPSGAQIAIGESPSGGSAISLWDSRTGRLLKTLSGYQLETFSLSFSPDGQRIAAGGMAKRIGVWSTVTGELLQELSGHSEAISIVRFSHGGSRIFSLSSDNALKLWDVTTGRLLSSTTVQSGNFSDLVPPILIAANDNARFIGKANNPDDLILRDVNSTHTVATFRGAGRGEPTALAFSPDGSRVLIAHEGEPLRLWDVNAGRPVRTFLAAAVATDTLSIARSANHLLSAGFDNKLRLWDLATGRLLRSYSTDASVIKAATFSPGDDQILFGGDDGRLRLLETASGNVLRTFAGHEDGVNSVAFSADGQLILSGSSTRPDDRKSKAKPPARALKLWDAATGRLITDFGGYADWVGSVALSPNGRYAASSHADQMIRLWEATTGRLMQTLQGLFLQANAVAFSPDGARVAGAAWGAICLWDVGSGRLLRKLDGPPGFVWALAYSPDGKHLVSGGMDGIIRVWDADTGLQLRSLRGHTGQVKSLAISADGEAVLSGSLDGTIRRWQFATGEQTNTIVSGRDDDSWLSIAPGGFFDRSVSAGNLLSIVRGLESTGIEQVHQSLFNPDLVREAIAGDPDQEVKKSLAVVDLDKVLGSGPPPDVTIALPAFGATSNKELVQISARIVDRGRGIGRIEWRVNGVTVAARMPAQKSRVIAASQQIALDAGENTVEVVAYNAGNLLASPAAQIKINYLSPRDPIKPTLHALTIGINKYIDEGWTTPGSDAPLTFAPLNLAVPDAKAVAAALREAGEGAYAAVKVTEALDTDATLAGLQRLIERIASEVHPRDTFILFAAAHGTSNNGRFFLIPQDFNGGTNPAALQSRAIGQERLQDWISNSIKARRVIVLLDTCESGALVSGSSRSRLAAPASEAAIGRLHEATGRPILTAAAEGKPAFEGYEGHGVFTWAILDALRNGDRNANGAIELSELVAHAQDQVPKVSTLLNGRGRVALAARGSTDRRQSARFGSRGEDYMLLRRLPR